MDIDKLTEKYLGEEDKKKKNVCPKCNKPQKEDTEGNPKYCQGHSIFDKK
jgi:hypothetical protein